VTVPTLVIQGTNDPFGIPPSAPSRRVVTVPGDHGLKSDPKTIRDAVRSWLVDVASTPFAIARGRSLS
jgi:hypothetical protein